MASSNPGGDQARYISNLVRQADRDRYLAAILAPRNIRAHLLALYAFDLEIQAIPDRVSESLAGEIRIQWWRDWLLEYRNRGKSGNPVADALDDAIRANNLSVELLHEYLDTWSSIYQSKAPNQIAMERRLIGVELPILTLAVESLAGEPNKITGELADLTLHAGYIRLLKCIGSERVCFLYLISSDFIEENLNLPANPKAGEQAYVALGVMAAERQSRAATAFQDIPGALRPAFAHLAAYSGIGVTDRLRRPNPFLAQWRIWRAVRSGRL